MASRLSQIQARFQQKQMQEKEEKLLRLYETQQQRAFDRVNRGSAGSNDSNTSTTRTQGGKVRQMFDERRQKAGRDRSYPLEPLKTNNARLKDNNKNVATKTVLKQSVQKTITEVRNGKPVVRQEVSESVYNNNDGDESYEERNESFFTDERQRELETLMNDVNMSNSLDDEEMPDLVIDEIDEPVITGKLANVGGKLPSQNGLAKTAEVKQEVTAVKPVASLKKDSKPLIKRTITKASSPLKPPSTGPSPVHSAASKSASPPRTPSKRVSSTVMSKQSSQSNTRAPSTGRPSAKQTTSRNTPNAVNRDDLNACRYCSRRFAADRLETHEEICARTAKKKRKAYDAMKHRVQGTELEPYTRRPMKSGSAKASRQSQAKKGDWRCKHEEFISAIRAAKMAQAHVAKGGKLSDLPPPPPSSNPDYVQCPHCGRRFNESAAERHIPKCAQYSFNKPNKPGGIGSKANSSRGSFR